MRIVSLARLSHAPTSTLDHDVTRSRRLPGYRWAAAALLATSALCAPLLSFHASASIGLNRNGPILKLSDGHIMQLWVTVNDDPADVQQVVYDVHVPAGVTLEGTVFTGGALKNKQVVHFFSDNVSNTYSTDTIVQAGHSAPASTETRVPSVGDATASGLTNQHLNITLQQ